MTTTHGFLPPMFWQAEAKRGLQASIVTLTPQWAQTLLDANLRNRKASPTIIKEYGNQMTEGLWVDGVAVIAVDTNGLLINGQHVCHGVIKSGIAINCVMVTGLSPAAFAAFDAHHKRTGGQTLALTGVKHANTIAAAIRRVRMIQTKATTLKVYNAETSAIYNSDPLLWDVLASTSEEVRALGRNSKLSLACAAIGAFLYFAQAVESFEEAAAFAMSVADDSGHAQGKPATSLRRWLIGVHRGGGGAAALVEHSAWVRSWNAHVEQRSLSKVYASADSIPTMLPFRREGA